ncbi:MAG TPA: nitroreductase/quinone reductase family protein [Candidatus Dormibacteraeota bacterium]|nr:nitroreductase/quinone reductase family protein [Candidatus Dormibacteraeota bacterium]
MRNLEKHLLARPIARRLLGQAPTVLALAGVSVLGTHLLSIRQPGGGRTRVVAVTVLRHRGRRYVVAHRGVTPWVRSLRAASEAELRLGRRTEPIRAIEVPEAERPPLLRAHLRQWRPDTSNRIEGLGAGAPDSELLRIAPAYPVFLIEATGPIATSPR